MLSTDRCNDGGWLTFIDGQGQPFRNQYRCINYFIRNPVSLADLAGSFSGTSYTRSGPVVAPSSTPSSDAGEGDTPKIVAFPPPLVAYLTNLRGELTKSTFLVLPLTQVRTAATASRGASAPPASATWCTERGAAAGAAGRHFPTPLAPLLRDEPVAPGR